MINRNRSVRIAVVDYDGCAYTHYVPSSKPGVHLRNIYPFQLSPALINEIKQDHCAGFYGCTHRTRLTTFSAVFSDARFAAALKVHKTKYNPCYGMTMSITENLQLLLGLPCHAVSTPDDFIGEAGTVLNKVCGSGFEKYIQPFEVEVMELNAEKIKLLQNTNFVLPACPEEVVLGHADPKMANISSANGGRNKNLQLLMVAHDARKRYPRAHIELHFYDDNESVCVHACQIDPQQLPKNVSLNVSIHSGLEQVTRNLGAVHGAQLHHNSLFQEHRSTGKQSDLKRFIV